MGANLPSILGEMVAAVSNTSSCTYESAPVSTLMEKAANVLGISTGNLIEIPVTTTGEMDIDILSQRLEQAVRGKNIPFFVAGTAGTTVRGAYDPIDRLLELRKSYGFWLHIDGAWGGAVLVSDVLKEKFMKGIESADSLTWDPSLCSAADGWTALNGFWTGNISGNPNWPAAWNRHLNCAGMPKM